MLALGTILAKSSEDGDRARESQCTRQTRFGNLLGLRLGGMRHLQLVAAVELNRSDEIDIVCSRWRGA